MKLGFLTWPLEGMEFDQILKWAHEAGFDCLGLSFWPEDLTETNELLDKYAIEAGSLGACLNYLTPDLAERERHVAQFRKTVDDAAALGVGTVDVFAGRDPQKSIEDNLPTFEQVFTDLLDYAEDKRIRVAIENCPMVQWPSGTNIAVSPETWERLFDLVPSPNLGLCFDPSHFIWQEMDYLGAVRAFGDRIFHVHAKDAEILEHELAVKGIWGQGWWRDRIPGFGDVDWPAFISTLREVGYDGCVDIEHEDRLFGFGGTPEDVKEGLLLSHSCLRPLIARIGRVGCA